MNIFQMISQPVLNPPAPNPPATQPSGSKSKRRNLLIETLEDRTLFDAALGVDANLWESIAQPLPTAPAQTVTPRAPLAASGPDLFVTHFDGVSNVRPGDLLIYEISYFNDLPVMATGVILTETISAGTTYDSANSDAGWVETSPGSGVFTFQVGTVDGDSDIFSVNFAVTVDDHLPAGIDRLTNTVTISDDESHGPDATPFDNTSTDTNSIFAVPNLSIASSDGGITAAPGQTIVYTLTYRNIGDQDATGVVISNPLPDHTSFNATDSTAGWTLSTSGTYEFLLGPVGAGDVGTVKFAVQVDSNVPAGVTAIENTTTIEDDATNGPDPFSNNSDTVTTPLSAPPADSVDLLVTNDDDGITTTAGGLVVYTLDYRNRGELQATGVVITEHLPSGSSFDASNSSSGWTLVSPGTYEFAVGNVSSGGTGSIQFAVIVQSPVDIGRELLTNLAEISDDGSQGQDSDTTNNSAVDYTPITAAPDLYVTSTDGQANVSPGDLLVYTLTYGNSGTQAAANAVIHSTLPDGTTFDSSNSSSGWQQVLPGQFEFQLGTLTVSPADTVTFAVIVNDPLQAGVAQLTHTVSISDDGENGDDLNNANNRSTDIDSVAAAPDLFITNTDHIVSIIPGGTSIYELAIGNSGSQDATGVVVTETLSPGVTFNASASTSGWVETVPGSGVYEFAVGDVASGDPAVTLLFAVKVDNAVSAGVEQLVNTATVADDAGNGLDEDTSNNSATDSTTVIAVPDVAITHSNPGESAVPGSTFVYTLTYSNQGNQDATGVEIRDQLPDNTVFDAANSSSGWTETSPGSGVYRWIVGDLPAATSASIFFAVQVDPTIAAGIDRTQNTATIVDDGSQGVDPNTPNNTSTQSTAIAAAPNLSIAIDDGQTSVGTGDSLTYTLTYRNHGTQDAVAVVIEQVLSAGVQFDASNSTTGWTETSPGSRRFRLELPSLAAGTQGTARLSVIVDETVAAGLDQLTQVATIHDNGDNGSDVDDSDNRATDINDLVAAPDLYVNKSDDVTSAAPGELVTYRISFGNRGTQSATGVVIIEQLPQTAVFVPGSSTTGWTLADESRNEYHFQVSDPLDPGSTSAIEIAYRVANPLASGIESLESLTQIHDDADNGADLNPQDNSASDTNTPLGAPDLRLLVTDGDSSTTPGGIATYVLQYENVGVRGATGVVITETLPVGTTFNAVDSTPGWVETPSGSGNFTFAVGTVEGGTGGSVTFSVNVADPLPGSQQRIENTASIADDGRHGADTDLTNNTSSDSTPVVSALDLVVRQQLTTASVQPNSLLIYTLAYENTGNVNATGVVLTERTPEGATYDPTNSSTGWIETSAGSGIYEFAIGQLNSGDSGTVNFAVIVDNPVRAGLHELVNTATIVDDQSHGADANTLNNTDVEQTPIDAAPDLFISKDDGTMTVQPGNAVIYTIAYGNRGSQGATGVVIRETLPPGSRFDSNQSTDGWVETSPGSGIFEWTAGSLTAGDTGSVKFAVVVDDPLAASITQLVSNVSISDDGSNGTDEDDRDNAATDVNTIDRTITMVDLAVSTNNTVSIVSSGDRVVYSIVYHNNGNIEATGVVLRETMPAGATFNADHSSTGWTEVSPGRWEFSVGRVASGDTGTVNFAVDVDNPLAAGIDQLVNNVEILDDRSHGLETTPDDNVSSHVAQLQAAPDLFITTESHPTQFTSGSHLAYGLTFGNRGTQDATGVVITEVLPQGSRFDPSQSTNGWTETTPGSGTYQLEIGNLAAGEANVTAVFAIIVDDPVDPQQTELIHSVSIRDDQANGSDLDTTNNSSTDTAQLSTTSGTGTIDLFVLTDDGSPIVVAGDVVTYSVDFGNRGTQTATGVVITERLSEGASFHASASTSGWTETSPGSGVFEFAVGDLVANSGTQTIAFAVTIDSPLADNITSISSTATIQDDGQHGNDINSSDNVAHDDTPIRLATSPDLTLDMSTGDLTITPGGIITYTLTYRNVGNGPATGVVLTERLAPGTTFVPSSSSQGWVVAEPGVLRLQLGEVNAGDQGTVRFAVQLDSTVAAGLDWIHNEATIHDDQSHGGDLSPDDNTASESNSVLAAPNYQITVDDQVDSVSIGDTISYSIFVTNIGNQGGTNVTVTDQLPTGFLTNVTASDGGVIDLVAGTVTWTLPELMAGDSMTLTVTGEVVEPNTAQNSSFTNRVSVTDDLQNGSDPVLSNNSESDTNAISSQTTPFVDLAITKDHFQTSVLPGETVTYSITLSNLGTGTGNNIVVTDVFSTDIFATLAADRGGVVNLAEGTVVWSIDSLAPEQTIVFTLTGQLKSEMPAGATELVHRVSATDDGSLGDDPNVSNNQATDADTIIAAPDLSIVTTDSNGTTAVDGIVVYTLTYANHGNQDATGVVIEESLPAGTVFHAERSSQGWVETSSGNWTFTAGDLAVGESRSIQYAVKVVDSQLTSVVNQASVTDDGSNGEDNDLTNNTAEEQTPVWSGRIEGLVFNDLNRDGIYASGDEPISGVTMVLTGTDDFGNAISRTTTTNSQGIYVFDNLPPATYVIRQEQPLGYADVSTTTGTPGATAGTNEIHVPLSAGQSATANNFSEFGRDPESISKRYLLASTSSGAYESLDMPGTAAAAPAGTRMSRIDDAHANFAAHSAANEAANGAANGAANEAMPEEEHPVAPADAYRAVPIQRRSASDPPRDGTLYRSLMRNSRHAKPDDSRSDDSRSDDSLADELLVEGETATSTVGSKSATAKKPRSFPLRWFRRSR